MVPILLTLMQELDNLLLPMIDNDDLKNHIS